MATFKGDGKMIFTIFIGVIIVVTFMSPISDSIFSQTNTIAIANQTVTAPAVNGTLDLTGRELVGTGIVTNSTGDLVNGGTIATATSATSGLRTVQLAINDTAAGAAGNSVNVSYTYNPDGYLSNTGARSISGVILIIAALAIVVFIILILFGTESTRKLLRI